MALLLWQFWLYSFFGYLLEKIFAAVTQADKQGRKGFLLLPLCPVYGLGVLAVLALPPSLTESFWVLALWGGLAATAVEYGVHWWYDHFLQVRFWDYGGVAGNMRGRVCLPFSVVWGLLLAVALPWVQPPLEALAAAIPETVTYGLLLLFTVDAVCSVRVLLLTGDTEALSLRRLRETV